MNKIDIRQLENRLINTTKPREIIQGDLTKNFGQVLEKIRNSDEKIKFSKHATERLNSRNVNLSSDDMKRLESALNKADSKGVKDVLILMDEKAFIANIHSKTIITTVNKEQLKENIFTNIDGAVII